MAKKQREKQELDMETTIADMNVEGFSWYDPKKKKNSAEKPKQAVKLTKKEQRALTSGLFRAMFPMLCCIFCGLLFMVLLAYLWLK